MSDPDLSNPAVISAYDELPLWSALFGQLLLDEVPMGHVGKALDVGCGTGFPLIELAERLGPPSEVHGIDTWKGATERAAAKIAARGTANAFVQQASATQVPFPAATFDLIVSNLGVNNFEDRRHAMRECRRVAKKGAVLALTTNLQGHMRELYEVFESVLAKNGPALERLRVHVAHRATLTSVRELVSGAGFDVTRVVERQAVLRYANGTALLSHFFIRLGFLPAWKQIVPGHEERLVAALRTKLDEIGELRLTIPMAYFEAVAR